MIDGQWTFAGNYTICLNNLHVLYTSEPIVVSVAYIVLTFAIPSMIALFLSLFIFCYFRSLHCSRLTVHRNLCIALIIYSVFLLPRAVMVVSINFTPNEPWVCKAITCVSSFSRLTVVSWMFLEGLLLHTRVTINVFHKDVPFKIYYAIGWVLPALLVVLWSTLMSLNYEVENDFCWDDYDKMPAGLIWLITGPMLFALTINLIFLINIIRVLVTKTQAGNPTELDRIKRAAKATALLFPLLGMTHILFIYSPGAGEASEEVFWILNTIMKSSQGLVFSILYCFTDSDVQTAIKHAYKRSLIRRSGYLSRYRSSRAMSQTSNTYLSHSEANTLEVARQIRETKITLVDQQNGKSSRNSCVVGNVHKIDETLTML